MTNRTNHLSLYLVTALLLAGCKQSMSENDAIFYAYCTGIYPHAEIAIQRGYLNYPRGSFQRVADRAASTFPAPANWSQENLEVFQREIRRGQNHGSAISRGDVQRNDIARLDACIQWTNEL